LRDRRCIRIFQLYI